MKEKICIHCYVTGKVQGVWFRASTKEQAEKLNITGWVKNLPDGKVEVLACGDKTAIEQFYAWLQQGPQLARVDAVSYEELSAQVFAKFEVV